MSQKSHIFLNLNFFRTAKYLQLELVSEYAVGYIDATQYAMQLWSFQAEEAIGNFFVECDSTFHEGETLNLRY